MNLWIETSFFLRISKFKEIIFGGFWVVKHLDVSWWSVSKVFRIQRITGTKFCKIDILCVCVRLLLTFFSFFFISLHQECHKQATGTFLWEFFSHTPDLNPEHSTNSFGHHSYPAPPLWFNLNDSAELCSFPGGLRWIGNLPLLCNYSPKRSFGPSWFISIYQRGAFRKETRTFQGSSTQIHKTQFSTNIIIIKYNYLFVTKQWCWV